MFWDAIMGGIVAFSSWKLLLSVSVLILSVHFLRVFEAVIKEHRGIGLLFGWIRSSILSAAIFPLFLAATVQLVTGVGEEFTIAMALKKMGPLLLSGLVGLFFASLLSLVPIINLVVDAGDEFSYVAMIPVILYLELDSNTLFADSVAFLSKNFFFFLGCILFIRIARVALVAGFAAIARSTDRIGWLERHAMSAMAPLIILLPVFATLNLVAHDATVDAAKLEEHVVMTPEEEETFFKIVDKAFAAPLTTSDIEQFAGVWEGYLSRFPSPVSSEQAFTIFYEYVGPFKAMIQYNRQYGFLLQDAVENRHSPPIPGDFLELQQALLGMGLPEERARTDLLTLQQVGVQGGRVQLDNGQWYLVDVSGIRTTLAAIDMVEENFSRLTTIVRRHGTE